MGESLVGHLPSKDSVTDLMTKVKYGDKRRYLVSNNLYDIRDNHRLPLLINSRMHTSKLYLIGYSINLEGNISMHP